MQAMIGSRELTEQELEELTAQCLNIFIEELTAQCLNIFIEELRCKR